MEMQGLKAHTPTVTQPGVQAVPDAEYAEHFTLHLLANTCYFASVVERES
jgi:hypothetical protein